MSFHLNQEIVGVLLMDDTYRSIWDWHSNSLARLTHKNLFYTFFSPSQMVLLRFDSYTHNFSLLLLFCYFIFTWAHRQGSSREKSVRKAFEEERKDAAKLHHRHKLFQPPADLTFDFVRATANVVVVGAKKILIFFCCFSLAGGIADPKNLEAQDESMQNIVYRRIRGDQSSNFFISESAT